MTEWVHPRSLSEFSQVLTAAEAAEQVMPVEGAGTKLDWLTVGPQPHQVVGFEGWVGLVEHAPGDMRATVRAGTSLSELQAALGGAGQRLALDPPLGSDGKATLGGIFACDDSGPARLAFGSLRELVIGGTFVLSDGTVARSGGRVIKNVADYDLCKLFCGSRGTLGLAVELTLRLHPVADAERTLKCSAPPDQAAKVALRLSSGQMAPTAVTVQERALWIRFEGTQAEVSAQLGLARARVRESGLDEGEALEGEASQTEWRRAVELRRARSGEVTVACATPPVATHALISRVSDLDAATVRVVSDPLLGLTLLHLPPADLPEQAAWVEQVRSWAQALNGHVRLRSRPLGFDEVGDPYGPMPSALPLMKAVKRQLDPCGRLMPGRYLV